MDIKKWMYEREEKRINMELDMNGLEIRDPDKFEKYIKRLSRKNLIYNIIFAILIMVLILKWLGVIS